MMEKAFKYRIYPNKKQKQLLAKIFGCCRFVFNYYLDRCIKEYLANQITLSYYDNAKDLTSLKKELVWLQEADSSALQNSIKDLNTAFQRYFKHVSEHPCFKSKKTNRFSYRSQCNYSKSGATIQFLGNYLKLPKLGNVKTRNKLIPQGKILSATVSQDPSGKYFVSILCTDVPETTLPKTDKPIGIDLGIKDFAITSDGDKYTNPKYLEKSLKKLAKLQRKLSRKTKGSRNRNKARIKVARLQEHIANQRYDMLQQLSTKLITDYDIICLEDLKVKNMVKNHKLARSISDVSWAEFVRQLEYKASWYGKTVVKISTWYPSSQTCHICGYKNSKITDLQIREWDCPCCHTHHDRDINAAINILIEGLKIYLQQVA